MKSMEIRSQTKEETRETSERPRNPENIETGQDLLRLQKKALEKVETNTQETKKIELTLEDTQVASLGLSKEVLEREWKTYQVDERLLENERQVNTLAAETKQEIIRVSEDGGDNEIKEKRSDKESSNEGRYREKITNLEARKLLEQNDKEITEMLGKFKTNIQEILKKNSGLPTKEEVGILSQENIRLAGKIIFGENNKSFFPYRTKGKIESVLQYRRERILKDKEMKMGQVSWDELNPSESKSTRDFIEKQADEEIRLMEKTIRSNQLDQTNASLFAIGYNEQLVSKFLDIQKKIQDIAPGENNGLEFPVFTSQDFELARHRAYYETRRTGENVFTHVTNIDNALKIFEEGKLRSTSLHSKDKTRAEKLSVGQIPHEKAEKSIYMASGGGGLWYGATSEGSYGSESRKNQTKESFVFFATLGNDMLSQGKSVEVASPTLVEKGEAQRGREIGDFDNLEGTELPVKDMVMVVADFDQYMKLLEELPKMGYDFDWGAEHIIEMPEDLKEKIFDKNGEIKTDPESNKTFSEWVTSGLKKEMKKVSSNSNKIFATVKSRKSDDSLGGTINKWQEIN